MSPEESFIRAQLLVVRCKDFQRFSDLRSFRHHNMRLKHGYIQTKIIAEKRDFLKKKLINIVYLKNGENPKKKKRVKGN